MTDATDEKTMAEIVHETMEHCLFTAEEVPLEMAHHVHLADDRGLELLPHDAVVVPGIMRHFGFHPGRLKESDETIQNLVQRIPTNEFLQTENGDGGCSFLSLCYDRDGQLWTGLHLTMEAFFALASATGRAGFCAPREMWPMLPGGMPYIWFRHEP